MLTPPWPALSWMQTRPCLDGWLAQEKRRKEDGHDGSDGVQKTEIYGESSADSDSAFGGAVLGAGRERVECQLPRLAQRAAGEVCSLYDL